VSPIAVVWTAVPSIPRSMKPQIYEVSVAFSKVIMVILVQ
jgi:hypothetical protein